MKIVENTMRIETELWEDPGEYPSNAGGYAQRSYTYLEGEGAIIVEYDDNDNLLKFEDQISDFVESIVDVPRGGRISYNLEELEGSRIRITPKFN